MVERKVPVKVGKLTEPMVDVISKVMADCLDPGGNIDKECMVEFRVLSDGLDRSLFLIDVPTGI